MPKVPVIPAGQFDAARVTPELNPFTGEIVTVEAPVDPTTAVAAAALIVKFGGPVTVKAMLVLADTPPPAPVTVSV